MSDSTEDAAGEPAEAGDPVLLEPARQQVIALAGELVGRLPVDQLPASLRAIARFTPAKRQRLGAPALAAVLDADPQFRGRVAELVSDTSPDLAAAVRDGSATAAADPTDLAVVAYLLRPEGWRDVLAQANRRFLAERGGATDGGELARLRAELAAARTQLRAEPARLREARVEAAASAEAQLAQLRQGLRDRTRELRAIERERDQARENVRHAGERLERGEAAHDAELRRLRARVSELERAGASARRESRIERDIDDARLWLLIDTLVAAANGVRRELSLPATAIRPADTVSSAEPAPGGRSVADPVALDQLLAMPNVHLVIDGYNVTKTGYGDLALAEQRIRLVGALAPLAARSGAEVTVAFDGGAKPPAQPPAPRGVRVLFSAADEIADDLIRRLVAAEPRGRAVVVVTSDRQVATDVTRDGAWTVPSSVLLARLG